MQNKTYYLQTIHQKLQICKFKKQKVLTSFKVHDELLAINILISTSNFQIFSYKELTF